MPTITQRSDVIDLLTNKEFYEALLLDTDGQFGRKSVSFQNAFVKYHENKWADEGDECDGINLFATPRRKIDSNPVYGAWLEVSKHFANTDHPYRVSAYEYAPQGIEVDSVVIGEYATLGEAFDYAMGVHEQSRVEIYPRGYSIDPPVEQPGVENLSKEAVLINELLKTLPQRRLALEKAEKQAQQRRDAIHKLAWESPLSHQDAEPILRALKTKVQEINHFDYLDAMHIAASSINNRLFSGRGKLISYRCPDLDNHASELSGEVGTVFVAVKDESGEFRFYSADCGVLDNAEDARSAVHTMLTEKHSSRHETGPLYRIESKDLMVEIDLDRLEVEELKPVTFDAQEAEILEYNGGDGSNEYRIDQSVMLAVEPYRQALQKKVEADFIKRDAMRKVSVDSESMSIC